jgi:hypothetical protein
MDLTGIGSVSELGSKVVDLIQGLFPAKMTDEQKALAQLKIQELGQSFESSVISTQRDIIMSELAQGDAFTKRARPAIVWLGLLFIALNHVVIPAGAWFYLAVSGKPISPPALQLPEEFWWSWTGLCSTWIIGRSAEKRGSLAGTMGKVVGAITGNK